MATRNPSASLLKWLLPWLCRLQASRDRTAAAPGLTLIECLVAIVIIALTVVSVTPPVFLATASRVQSRRAEQANQIAQGEIDRIRTLVERQDYSFQTLPSSTGNINNIQAFQAPAGVNTGLLASAGNCANPYPQAATAPPAPPITPVSATQLVPVDINGDCTPEYAMQVFRSEGCVPAEFVSQNPPPYSFYVGVRVYAYAPNETRTYTNERANLGLTAGKRDDTGTVRKPLQTLYTKMIRPNSSGSMECSAADSAPAPPPGP